MEQIWDKVIDYSWNIALGLITLVIGLFLIKWVLKLTSKALDKKTNLEGYKKVIINVLKIWDTSTFEEKKSLKFKGNKKTAKAYPIGIEAIAISPNGKYLAIGGGDCIIRILDFEAIRKDIEQKK